MKRTLFLFMLFFISSCTIVGKTTHVDSCRLIKVAIDEGTNLSVGWYLKAADVMRSCGDELSYNQALRAACFAERKDDILRSCSH